MFSIKNKNWAKNSYVYDSENYRSSVLQHRNIVSEALNRKLYTEEVVHHVDMNTKNNDLSNLIVLLKNDHSRLHHALDMRRFLAGKHGEN